MKVKHLLQAGLWLGACSLVVAQTTPSPAPRPAAAKPAATATPAAKPEQGRTLSLGGGSGGGALLGREELRACLNQEVSIRTR